MESAVLTIGWSPARELAVPTVFRCRARDRGQSRQSRALAAIAPGALGPLGDQRRGDSPPNAGTVHIERSFAWFGRNQWRSKDDECYQETGGTLARPRQEPRLETPPDSQARTIIAEQALRLQRYKRHRLKIDR